MADNIHPWGEIEAEYLQGKKLVDIAKDRGISYRMVMKHSHEQGWGKKKKALKRRVEKRIEKDIENEVVSEARKARKQLNGVANLLLNQGTQRFIDPKTKKPYKRAIKNVQTAVSALSAGAKIKMKLYDIGKDEEDDNKGDTNIFNFGDNTTTTEINLRGIPDAELERTHRILARRFGIEAVRQGEQGDSAKKKRKK